MSWKGKSDSGWARGWGHIILSLKPSGFTYMHSEILPKKRENALCNYFMRFTAKVNNWQEPASQKLCAL